eukprot:COSAG05_NODE_115_length_18028_cov_137.264767_7_plen_78_part_00
MYCCRVVWRDTQVLRGRATIDFPLLHSGRIEIEEASSDGDATLRPAEMANPVLPPFLRDLLHYSQMLDTLAKVNFLA